VTGGLAAAGPLFVAKSVHAHPNSVLRHHDGRRAAGDSGHRRRRPRRRLREPGQAWIHLYTQQSFQNEVDSEAVCPAASHADLKNSNAHDHVRSWAADGPAPQNGGKHVTVCLLDYVGSQRGGQFDDARQSSLGNNNDRADAVELC
jgi:hypothetical protein